MQPQDGLIDAVIGAVRTGNPILDAAIKHVASNGISKAISPKASPKQQEQSKARFIQGVRELECGLFLIIGTKGAGKTALSFRLLDMFAEHQHRPVCAVGIGEAGFPDHIKLLEVGEDIPNGSAVVFDDTNIIFSNRNYFDSVGQYLLSLITLHRHKNLIIIANTQQSASLNRYLLQADAVFIKPQSLLSAEYERGSLLRLTAEAEHYFRGMTMDEVHKWVYAVSVSNYLPPYKGMITYEPPSWYSDVTSKNKSGELKIKRQVVIEDDDE